MDEFFIGWQSEAPRPYARRSRQFVMALALFLPVLALLLVYAQRGFSHATFEYGAPTTVTGVYRNSPVPKLEISPAPGITTSLLLVGTGKHGAAGLLENLERQSDASLDLDGRTITLQGTLIYHDGKGLLEMAENQSPTIGNKRAPDTIPTENLGRVTLCGEIADPKCFFGVMKPGEGKPHRSCAIRCIAGGIPPVFKVENESSSHYYLLKGPRGEDISAQLLEYVADGVQISGTLQRQGDWLVLRTDPCTDIIRQRPYWIGKDEVMCGGQ